MANLRYYDKHNMVAFLKKPIDSEGFVEAVDFLKGTTLRTLANGTQQLVASIYFKEYTITEASIRSTFQLANATGIHNLSDAEIYTGLATLGDICGSRSYEEPLPEGNTSGSAKDSMQLKELMVLVPTLVTKINSKNSEIRGRKIRIDDDPLVSLVRESMKEKSTDFVTPTKALGEAQEEEISPTILEAAKTLSKVASQGVSKEKSTDKGKRYMRKARSMAKKIDTRLDAEEEINTGKEEVNTGIEEVSNSILK
ncbi:hypothetical protein Tco_1173244 [Tanacetum coccineum]